MSMIAYRRIKLTYPSSLLEQPILYRLITEFGVMVNVLEASVTPEQGWLLVELRGSADTVVQAMEWLADEGVQVDIVST